MLFDVILADPPWAYNNKGGKWLPDAYYPTMEVDEICALPVGELCSKNAALFLWVPRWLHPIKWIRVMEAWGFDYRTRVFDWVKSNPSGTGFRTGLGFYTRSNIEICPLGIKGTMPVIDKGVHSIIYAPITKHSEKPHEQYEKIERLYPNMKYCELFARKKREGWHSWGNEISSDVQLKKALGGK